VITLSMMKWRVGCRRCFPRGKVSDPKLWDLQLANFRLDTYAKRWREEQMRCGGDGKVLEGVAGTILEW
jgi:hypothetical protein